MVATKIKEIQLEGSFYQMGQDYVCALSEELLDQKKLFLDIVCPRNPALKEIFDNTHQKIINAIQQCWPEPYKLYVAGCVQASTELKLGLTEFDFITLDQLTTLSKLAMIIAALSKADQKEVVPNEPCRDRVFTVAKDQTTSAVRHHGWSKKMAKVFTEHPVVVHFHNMEEGYSTPILAMGYVGQFSCTTIMTDFCHIAVNRGVSNLPPDKRHLVPQRSPYGTNVMLAVMRSQNFEALKQDLLNTPFDEAQLITLTGKDGQLACLECSPYLVSKPEGFKNRLLTTEKMAIITNDFQLNDWDVFLGSDAPIRTPNEHSDEKEALEQAYQKFNGTLVLKTFGELLERKSELYGQEDLETATYYQTMVRFNSNRPESVKTKWRVAQEVSGEKVFTEWHTCARP